MARSKHRRPKRKTGVARRGPWAGLSAAQQKVLLSIQAGNHLIFDTVLDVVRLDSHTGATVSKVREDTFESLLAGDWLSWGSVRDGVITYTLTRKASEALKSASTKA